MQAKVDPAKLAAELAARRQVSEANALLLAKALELMAQLARVLSRVR